MPQCAISSCTNSQRRTQDQQQISVRYHRFPSDATTRSKWIRACGKQTLNVDSARVCSLHFSPLSYKSDKVLSGYTSKKCLYKSRLKKGVIPHLGLHFSKQAKIVPKRKHYNLTTRQRFNNTLCALKNSVSKRVIEVDDFVESVWSDSEFPVLYAVGLRPIKSLKTCLKQNTSNGSSDKELSKEDDTMLVMEESTETIDNIGSTPPRIENPTETTPEPTKPESKPPTPIPSPDPKIEEEEETKEEIKLEESKLDQADEEIEKVIELDDSDLIELDEEEIIEKQPEEPQPKKLKIDEQEELKCLTEITELDEMIKQKEKEWNQLIVTKKMKEIELLRIQRRKQILGITKKSDVDWELALDQHLKILNRTSESAVTILPIPSTSTSPRIDRLRHFRPDNRSLLNKPRSILPKNTSIFMECQNGATLSALKTGPKGQPMMDVNLIVEKFRQSNPDVPRRGKRIRSVLRSNQEDTMVSSTSRMLPMISMRPRSIRPNEPKSELGLLLSGDPIRGRDSQNDSSRSSADSEVGTPITGNVSFKDALVEFARLSQQQTTAGRPSTGIVLQNPGSSNSTLSIKPIPTQPEVTLHPVLESQIQQSPKSSNSLLHGILTKTKPKNQPKTFTTLSPTLARLLTDTSSQPSDVSNINDLLAVTQNRLLEAASPQRFGDTPIDATTRRPANIQFSNSPVVNVDDMDNDDSLDRLIIDESADAAPNTSKPKPKSENPAPSEVLHCQGCNKNSAQFVCAGCTNQWYCSRECQVQDWDRHCETCLG